MFAGFLHYRDASSEFDGTHVVFVGETAKAVKDASVAFIRTNFPRIHLRWHGESVATFYTWRKNVRTDWQFAIMIARSVIPEAPPIDRDKRTCKNCHNPLCGVVDAESCGEYTT